VSQAASSTSKRVKIAAVVESVLTSYDKTLHSKDHEA
jgi:hypothetical protein